MLLLSLAAGITVILLFGNDAGQLLRFERASLINGEWWRWITAHFVHLNVAHLSLNLAGLALCGLLVGQGLTGVQGISVLTGALLGCSLGLWLLNPQLEWYVGLSGVLHGLLLGGALGLPRSQQRWKWIIAALVLGKLVFEQFGGPPLATQKLIEHSVIVDAHLYGAAGGTLGWFIYRALSAPRTRP